MAAIVRDTSRNPRIRRIIFSNQVAKIIGSTLWVVMRVTINYRKCQGCSGKLTELGKRRRLMAKSKFYHNQLGERFVVTFF